VGYKTLLLHVENTPQSEARLRLACNLAMDLQANIIGVGGLMPAYMGVGGESAGMYADGALVQELSDINKREIAKAEKTFHQLTSALAGKASWRVGEGYPDQAIQACAAGADLIVASPTHGPYSTTIDAGRMALTCGIPVLTLPTELTALRNKSVLVAWKNTRESRRAVTDALPLLSAAHEVIIVEVTGSDTPSDTSASLSNVVDRLKHHGVTAERHIIRDTAGDVAERILDYAENCGADLIVAGAYGHSRLREWSFGGMTRGLLSQSRLPVLFSH
jgi:nucleotide-binding universal stress UspA family protein